MRGQASVEYLALTAFLLIVVAGAFSYSFISYNDAVKLTQLDLAGKQLQAAVEQVQLEGRGSARLVEITVPDALVIEVLPICDEARQPDHIGGSPQAYCRDHADELCDLTLQVHCKRAPYAKYSVLRLRTASNTMISDVSMAGVLDEGFFENPANLPASQGTYKLVVYSAEYAPNHSNIIRIKQAGE